MSKISSGTVIRTAVLAVALINQALAAMGKSPLPFSDETLTEIISIVFTISAAIPSWWKNNSFTSNAIAADEYKEQLNEGR